MLPGEAGNITGQHTFAKGDHAAIYSVDPIANANKYTWTLPGGAYIVAGANTNTITVYFSMTATDGNITVSGSNTCSAGTVSPLFAIMNPVTQVAVYPIPNNGRFTAKIESSIEGQFTIRIYNHAGDRILEIKDATTINGNYEKLIDLRPIPSGVYYIEIVNGNFRETRKLLINK